VRIVVESAGQGRGCREVVLWLWQVEKVCAATWYVGIVSMGSDCHGGAEMQ